MSQVRALYKGSDITITDKVVLRATVISNYMHTDNGGLNNYTSMKAIVVSDAEAGIQLFVQKTMLISNREIRWRSSSWARHCLFITTVPFR